MTFKIILHFLKNLRLHNISLCVVICLLRVKEGKREGGREKEGTEIEEEKERGRENEGDRKDKET